MAPRHGFSGGMPCPKCGGGTACKDSRPRTTDGAIRRRRQCLHCEHRFTTIEAEMPENASPARKEAAEMLFTLSPPAFRLANKLLHVLAASGDTIPDSEAP